MKRRHNFIHEYHRIGCRDSLKIRTLLVNLAHTQYVFFVDIFCFDVFLTVPMRLI